MREIHQDFAEWQAHLDQQMIEKERVLADKSAVLRGEFTCTMYCVIYLRLIQD